MSLEPTSEMAETFAELTAWFEQFLLVATHAAESGTEGMNEITRRVAYYQGYMDATQLSHDPGDEVLANGRLRLGIELDALDPSARQLRRKGPDALDGFDLFLDLLRQYQDLVEDTAMPSADKLRLRLEVARFGGYREAISVVGHDPGLVIHGIVRLRESIESLKKDIGS